MSKDKPIRWTKAQRLTMIALITAEDLHSLGATLEALELARMLAVMDARFLNNNLDKYDRWMKTWRRISE